MNRETQKAGASVIAHIDDKRAKTLNPPSPLGTDLGSFDRGPCGECWHWKRAKNGQLDHGTCMAGPPVAFPIQMNGQMAQAITRPILPATHEGCDEWDDSPEDDGGGEKLRAGGAG